METTTQAAQATTHPLMKSYMFVSSKHINFNDLSAFESVALAFTLVLTVTAGSALSLLTIV